MKFSILHFSNIRQENYSGDQIDKNEMGEECSTYERWDICMQGFGWDTWEKVNTWKTQA
jgi:hypothetical protein